MVYKDGESYDSYRGIKKLMAWAKGVSVKDRVWDDKGNQSALDYDRMLKIVILDINIFPPEGLFAKIISPIRTG